MNYLSVFLIGLIVGLLVDVFLSFYSSGKRKIFSFKNIQLATKDDILKITNELEKLRNISKINYGGSIDKAKDNETEEVEEIPEIDENGDAEKEFYESIAREG